MNLATTYQIQTETPIAPVRAQVDIDVVIGALKAELMVRFSQEQFDLTQDLSADGFCIVVSWFDGTSGYKLLNTLGKYSIQGMLFQGETYSYDTLDTITYEGKTSQPVDSIRMNRLHTEAFLREAMDNLEGVDLSEVQIASNRDGEGYYPRYSDLRKHLENREKIEALRHEIAYRSGAGKIRTEASKILSGSSLLAKAARVLTETQSSNYSQADLDKVSELEADYLYVLQSIKTLDASYRTIYNEGLMGSIKSKGYRPMNLKETLIKHLQDAHDGFVDKVWKYFSNKYQVKLINYKPEGITSHGQTIKASDLLKNITGQIGSSFEDLSEKQIIDEGTKQFYSYERGQVFTGKVLKLTGQLRLDPYNTKKKKEMSYEWFHKELPILKRAVAFFETNSVSDEIIKTHSSYFEDAKWFDAGQWFEAPEGNMITKMRFFGNGTLQLTFDSKENGQKFVDLYSILTKEGGKSE